MLHSLLFPVLKLLKRPRAGEKIVSEQRGRNP